MVPPSLYSPAPLLARALHPAERLALPLCALALFLLPFGRAMEVPLALLALCGLHGLCTAPAALLRVHGLRWLLACFAAYSLPMWLSLPDAVNPGRSLSTCVGSLRYLLSGVGLLYLLHVVPAQPQSRRVFDALEKTLGAVLLLWVLDALLQAVTGTNLLGYAAERGYLNGLFGAGDNLKLSLALCVLAPVALLGRGGRQYPRLALLLLVLTLSVLLLTGKRSAWFTAALLGLLAAFYHRQYLRRHLRSVLAGALLCTLALVPTGVLSGWVSERAGALITAVKAPDYAHLNVATGLRLPIWQGAVAMIEAHPLNGVGVRGFRYAYAEFAAAEDPFAQPATGGGARAAHAHLLLLEVLSDTGLFGLLGYLAMLGLLCTAWWRQPRCERMQTLPWLLAALALAQPLNSQGAWYSSWTASLFWLLLVLCLARLWVAPAAAPDSLKHATQAP